MSDWIDESVELQDLRLRIELEDGQAPEPMATTNGECINECGEPALQGGHFCSRECRDDHDKREGASSRMRGT